MYSRSHALQSSRLITKLFQQRSPAAFGKYYILKYRRHSQPFPQFVVSAGKKIEKSAPGRNYQRRVVSEIIRSYILPKWNATPLAVLVIVKKSAFSATFQQKQYDLQQLFVKVEKGDFKNNL